jgi:hypothetical protein
MAHSLTRRYTVDWGHLVFLAIIAAFVVCYFADAISVSTAVNNLLLVAPLSVLALILCVVVLPQCFRCEGRAEIRRGGGMTEIGASEIRSSDLKQLGLIGGVALSLGAYVFLLDIIGFDIASWVFTLVLMVLCGERRPLPLLIYPFVVAGLLIGAFRAILPFPMYTAIL